MYTINFEKRKPSRAQIMSKVIASVNDGERQIEILWGENWIELSQQHGNNRWCGYGWIKDIGGDDIAQDLNKFSISN